MIGCRGNEWEYCWWQKNPEYRQLILTCLSLIPVTVTKLALMSPLAGTVTADRSSVTTELSGNYPKYLYQLVVWLKTHQCLPHQLQAGTRCCLVLKSFAICSPVAAQPQFLLSSCLVILTLTRNVSSRHNPSSGPVPTSGHDPLGLLWPKK